MILDAIFGRARPQKSNFADQRQKGYVNDHLQMIQSNGKVNFNRSKKRVFTNKRNLSESLKTDSLVGSQHAAKFFNEQDTNIRQLLFGTSKREQNIFNSFSHSTYILKNFKI